jgi:hypothetical protein
VPLLSACAVAQWLPGASSAVAAQRHAPGGGGGAAAPPLSVWYSTAAPALAHATLINVGGQRADAIVEVGSASAGVAVAVLLLPDAPAAEIGSMAPAVLLDGDLLSASAFVERGELAQAVAALSASAATAGTEGARGIWAALCAAAEDAGDLGMAARAAAASGNASRGQWLQRAAAAADAAASPAATAATARAAVQQLPPTLPTFSSHQVGILLTPWLLILWMTFTHGVGMPAVFTPLIQLPMQLGQTPAVHQPAGPVQPRLLGLRSLAAAVPPPVLPIPDPVHDPGRLDRCWVGAVRRHPCRAKCARK